MRSLAPRTKVHLQLRGFIETPPAGSEPNVLYLFDADKRSCIDEYYALTLASGQPPSSSDLMRNGHSRLYRSIRSAWGTFDNFRTGAGVVLASSEVTPRYRDREMCVARYIELSRESGSFVNARYLSCYDNALYLAILKRWGSLARFFSEERLYPKRRYQAFGDDIESLRAACRDEYRALAATLATLPSSFTIRAHSDGLYKRIKRGWASFEAFCDDIGVVAPRSKSKERPPKHLLRVVECVARMKQPVRAYDIAPELGLQVASARGALIVAHREGLLIRISRGLYASAGLAACRRQSRK
jgi:hypothetical protein